jgi:hypothetical protein
MYGDLEEFIELGVMWEKVGVGELGKDLEE